VNEATSPCPCGCGAELIGMVVEREAGVRANAAQAVAGQPVRPGGGTGAACCGQRGARREAQR